MKKQGGQNRFAGQGFGGPPNIGRGYGNEPVQKNGLMSFHDFEKMMQEARDKLAMEAKLHSLEMENFALKSQNLTLTSLEVTSALSRRRQDERIEELEESRQKWRTHSETLSSDKEECERKIESLLRSIQLWRDEYEPGVNNPTGTQQSQNSTQYSTQYSTQGQQDQYEPEVDDAGMERRFNGFGTKRSWEESQDDKETHCEGPSSARKKRSRGDRRRDNRRMKREEE
jgi:hypothetical protein